MRVKICGITSGEDAIAACEAGADALGFNFAEQAKPKNRYIDPGEAREIIAALPPLVTTVAVTVDAPVEKLHEYLTFVDLVQLHGDEPAKIEPGVLSRAIKVFRTGPNFTIESMLTYAVRGWMIDAYVPGTSGGAGVRADWEAARDAVRLGRPLILAGGLNPENVAEAIRFVAPYAVDVASGVERAPGRKDHEKVRAFIRNARLPVA